MKKMKILMISPTREFEEKKDLSSLSLFEKQDRICFGNFR